MKDVKLPSGAILKVVPAPFAESKALYQAILAELKMVEISTEADLSSLLVRLFCVGFSSPRIEACLVECLKRCLYQPPGKEPEKFTADTFEAVERREDFIKVYCEVAHENIFPFVKSLYVKFKEFLAIADATQS